MARIASACLTALAVAAAAPALAQTAAPPAPAPAPTMEAPASTMEAPAPAAAAPPAAPAPDASGSLAPAPEAAAPPPPPPLPDSPIARQIVQVIEQACLPLIRAPGTDPRSIAKTVGLRNTRDGWLWKGPGVNRLVISLPTTVNPSACQMEASFDVGQGPAIIANLAAWGAAQPAPLQQDRTGEESFTSGDLRYTTTNWVGWSASTRMGLAFTDQKKLDGSPAGKRADLATIAFSFRAVTAQDRQAQ